MIFRTSNCADFWAVTTIAESCGLAGLDRGAWSGVCWEGIAVVPVASITRLLSLADLGKLRIQLVDGKDLRQSARGEEGSNDRCLHDELDY